MKAGKRRLGYAPTYYPGTTDILSAREVTVSIGQEASNIDVALAPLRTATINGTAFDSHGRVFQMVTLADEIRGEGFGSFGAASRANVGSDGRFSIAHVPAGHYKLEATTITANGNTVDPPEMAIVPIDVNGVDIDGASLVGSTGGSVTGKIVAASGQLPEDAGRAHSHHATVDGTAGASQAGDVRQSNGICGHQGRRHVCDGPCVRTGTYPTDPCRTGGRSRRSVTTVTT